jgi:hypothetical protein
VPHPKPSFHRPVLVCRRMTNIVNADPTITIW